ncbi:MAG: alanine--tRNA ligase, partial [Acidobacteria bacterium]|nr:alanine--tRNA ligase [Acidobacteriota bacterium]
LPAPSVDTGAGLERVSAVLQGVKSNYDTDLIKPIIEFTAKLAGKEYKAETQEGFAMRVVADHARSTAFAIADGILPSNEGRNYVLRKIMRRAIYNGRENLGFKGEFFYQVCEFVIDFMKDAYPELNAQRDYIQKMVRLEEQRFGATLTVGLKKLDELIEKSKGNSDRGIEVIEQAKLYDTYGTPIDLMYVVLSQRGYKSIEELGEEGYRAKIEEHLKLLQQSGHEKQHAEGKTTKPAYVTLQRRHDTKTEFKGYETTQVEGAKVVALIKGDETVQSLQAGDEGEVILDQTPFYSESGGQVGDVGVLNSDNATAIVADTVSPVQDLRVHKVKVEKGSLSVGDSVTAQVDVEKRDATRRNHTATHLMHAALREVLGTHVKQAGSIVAPDYLRFDFSHYQPLTAAEIEEIENLVNYHILRNEPVQTDVLAIEDAMRSGAMALFGEKYGEKVRVLTVNGVEGIFSKELCGGTHVRATGDIGSFKITSDEAIASGTRRIRGVTGRGAFERFQHSETLLAEAAAKINASPAKLPSELDRLQAQLRDQQKEIEKLKLKLAQGGGGSDDQVTEINGIKLLVRKVEDLGKEGRRQLADSLTRKIAPGVVVIADVVEGKASLLVMVSNDAIAKVKAGNVIKQLPGARGGGKPDLAEGGVDADQLETALNAIPEIVKQMVGV